METNRPNKVKRHVMYIRRNTVVRPCNFCFCCGTGCSSNMVPEYKYKKYLVKHNSINDFVCLFVCFPGVTTHCGCIFTAR